MSGIIKTPLDAWAAEKIGVAGGSLSRVQLDRYQLARLQATVGWACHHSPFYRDLLAGRAASGLGSLADLRAYPFTTADDIRSQGRRFLCLSQSDISRVVTLDSSGTSGATKRFYFTPADQEATIAFFRYGMANLAEAGDRVLILLPGERPGSVGDLLAAALRRMGACPVPHGPPGDLSAALTVMERKRIACLVGIPAQVLALARWAAAAGRTPAPKSVLLSTDHVPRAIVGELKRLWGCDVFEHYGMTELGLGGGTDCRAHAGYHLHEADFHFEIVHPDSGDPVPDGDEGEVVVTTLARRGMPLIRYRTGDLSRILPGPCPCGSVLRRLAPVTCRTGGRIALDGSGGFTLADLDEALFAMPGLIGFTAAVDRSAAKLSLSVATAGPGGEECGREIRRALDGVAAIRQARQAGRLDVAVATEPFGGRLVPGTAKRAIMESN
jgi:phenylacetate-CoA ligase